MVNGPNGHHGHHGLWTIASVHSPWCPWCPLGPLTMSIIKKAVPLLELPFVATVLALRLEPLS